MPTTNSNNPPDTPTRAARATRPSTRAWKHLISDATNRTASAAANRALLRAHLAAADRLAAKRATLHIDKSPRPPLSSSLPPASVTVDPLYPPSTDWSDKISRLNRFVARPSSQLAAPLLLVLPDALTDLRSQLVVAASQAAVALAPLLPPQQHDLSDVLKASASAAAVTKRVIADAGRVSFLALLSHTLRREVWIDHVQPLLQDPHVSTRLVALSAVAQLCDAAPATNLTLVSEIVTHSLNVATLDKASQLRTDARGLLAQFRTRFGDAIADNLLADLLPEARLRLSKPPTKPPSAPSALDVKRPGSKRQAPNSNIRDMIKARRAALKAKPVPSENVVEQPQDEAADHNPSTPKSQTSADLPEQKPPLDHPNDTISPTLR